jgi:CTP:molybdopterin cytidylyltransferase MocA/ubiquinone/menaquinone biosynthesis C-methylase UbiE
VKSLAPAAAVVLAAGLGTRFGETPKLIAPLAGRPVLQHVLDTLHEAGIAPIVVVLGHASAAMRRAIEWRDEIQVTNAHPERGMLRSVLLGLRRLDEVWSVPQRTLIVLGDQPRLRVDQLQTLLATSADEERPFVVPRYEDGQAGNPVLLEASGRVLAEQFVVHRRKDIDRGLSQMFFKLPELVRHVDVVGANPDIDTPADLVALESRATVAAGYDALGADYADWSARVVDPARQRFVVDLMSRLSDGARVVDLGCGPGVPSTKQLAERFTVTGVDISIAQLALARRNVPTANFIEADIASVSFPDETIDAVTAFYSLIHLPRAEHSATLAKVVRWLKPGGLVLAALSCADNPDWTGDWLGQPMFFSGYDASTNRRMLTEAGFEIVRDEEVEIEEPEGPARFQWVLARRPTST